MGTIMKKISICIAMIWAMVIWLTVPGHGQKVQKLAQTGMKFLNVTTDARISGMADAVTAVEGYSTAMFLNPSAMAEMPHFADISFGKVDWIADIKYFYGSAAFSPWSGRYGVIGFTILSVDYGDMIGTIRDDNAANELGYVETGSFSPTALAFGIGYSKALSSKFSVGGNVKYVFQNMGSSIVGLVGAASDANYTRKSYSASVAAFDFGVLYKTGFRSLNIGMCIRNFSKEVRYEDESFQLPLIFRIGAAMDLLDIYPFMSKEYSSLLFSVDATHPRDYPEQINVGLEYLVFKTFSIRAGYSAPNDEYGFTTGIGFQQALKNYRLAVDYAYTPFGAFNAVHRLSAHFSL
ncbi:MAG: PorV/PorQ family protein [candidate division KSB1 bacterium]|nr:PorV/PorQ family protein [candidate division KSB1 bacterium]MDZ7375291.1 PorV/PorQ family protein [candidate division KSB1 bacterium]